MSLCGGERCNPIVVNPAVKIRLTPSSGISSLLGSINRQYPVPGGEGHATQFQNVPGLARSSLLVKGLEIFSCIIYYTSDILESIAFNTIAFLTKKISPFNFISQTGTPSRGTHRE